LTVFLQMWYYTEKQENQYDGTTAVRRGENRNKHGHCPRLTGDKMAEKGRPDRTKLREED